MTNNPVNTVANAQLFYMVISFLSVMIVSLISPWFVIFRHCKVLRGQHEEAKDVIVSSGLRVIGVIFISLKLAFLITILLIIEKFDQTTDDVEALQCSDQTTLKTIDAIAKALENCAWFDTMGLIAVAVVGVLELLTICLLCVF